MICKCILNYQQNYLNFISLSLVILKNFVLFFITLLIINIIISLVYLSLILHIYYFN